MQDDISSDNESDSDDENPHQDTDLTPTEDNDASDEDDVQKAKAFAKTIKQSKKSSGTPSKGGEKLAAALAELDMDNYDDEDDDINIAADRLFGASNNPGMAFYRNPKDDPYLKSNNDTDSNDDSEEEEDLLLRDTDLLIVATRNEDDVSHLEVWVYEEPDERGDGNLYVHHALILPAFPLSVAWGDCDPCGSKDKKSLAAIGSFEPGIEIWDLDVLDTVEPIATLGGADYEAARALAMENDEADEKNESKKKKKKKAKLPRVPVKPGSHEDAVLGLAWNREYRNVLASASADTTVKIWDVATQQVDRTLQHHADKVQAVAWNPSEAPVLLSGGFDKQAALIDVRAIDSRAVVWNLPSDVEAMAWDPHSPTRFAVSTEDGEVLFFDARQGAGSSSLLTLKAHNKAASSLSYSPGVKNLLLTGSADKKTKIWSVDPGSGGAPILLAEEDLKVGAVFAAAFCRDAPLVVAAGGAKGTVAVWDTLNSEKVAAYVASIREVE